MTTLRLSIALAAIAAVASAASPAIDVSGNYVEARTADVYAGTCFINSEVQLVGNLGVVGWHINKGNWNGISLDGLGVVAAVRANSTLGDLTGEAYPVKSILIVDEKASLEQREALKQFARRMTGDLLEDIIRTEALPISFTVDAESIHEARVTLSAGTLAAIQTRAIVTTDLVCGHEFAFYPPLSKTDHAMPAVTVEHRFNGSSTGDLHARWSSPGKRSAFVATFHLSE
jgi:hypothetical protein